MTVAGKSLVVGAAVLALTACGGGSSFDPTAEYTGPQALVTMDGTNATVMASQASAMASGFVVDDFTGGYLKAGSAENRAGYRKAIELLKAARANPAVSLVGVTGSGSEPCLVSGSQAFSIRMANPERTSAGDYVSVTFDDCDDGDGVTIRGTLRITFTGTDGLDPFFGDPSQLTSGYEYGFRLTIMGFSITDNLDGFYSRISGDLKFSIVWNAAAKTLTESISGSGIASEAGDASGPLEASLIAPIPGTSSYRMHTQQAFADASMYDVVADAWGMSARICSMDLDGCLDVLVDPQFVTGVLDAYPGSGKLQVTGAGGAFVQIEATNANGSVTVTYDVDGSGPTAPVEYDSTWYCLDNPCIY